MSPCIKYGLACSTLARITSVLFSLRPLTTRNRAADPETEALRRQAAESLEVLQQRLSAAGRSPATEEGAYTATAQGRPAEAEAWEEERMRSVWKKTLLGRLGKQPGDSWKEQFDRVAVRQSAQVRRRRTPDGALAAAAARLPPWPSSSSSSSSTALTPPPPAAAAALSGRMRSTSPWLA